MSFDVISLLTDIYRNTLGSRSINISLYFFSILYGYSYKNKNINSKIQNYIIIVFLFQRIWLNYNYRCKFPDYFIKNNSPIKNKVLDVIHNGILSKPKPPFFQRYLIETGLVRCIVPR